MTQHLPKRIEPDAIQEAVIELRFDPPRLTVPEILYGRFADAANWSTFNQSRLPTADIPAPIRMADPNLQYQPAIELTSKDGFIGVRVGPQVASYVRRGRYPGWAHFKNEVYGFVDQLFKSLPDVNVTRIGVRYINTLKSDAHHINTLNDMDMKVQVGGEDICDQLNLNYRKRVGEHLEVMSRVATSDLAQGNIPDNTTIIVDIDVYTLQGYHSEDSEAVKKCISDAHDQEKLAFFAVLGTDATKRLMVE